MLISLGRAASDATPQRIDTPWADLVAWLYQCPRTKASITPDEYAHLKTFPSKSAEGQRIHGAKDGPYIALADFGGHRRAYETLIHSSGVPLDFDNGRVGAETIQATLVGLSYVAFTTFAHQPQAERWRVFLPTSRPMTADEHAASWAFLNERFQGQADPAAKDATRLSYLPGVCLIPEAARIMHSDGQFFAPTPVAPPAPATLQTHDGPVPGWAGPTDDTELLTIACNTRVKVAERFGGPISLAMLWTANAEWLHATYPSLDGSQPWDYTRADAALASELSYWTGGDEERVIRLMRQSGLAAIRQGDDDWAERKTRRAFAKGMEGRKPDQYHFMGKISAQASSAAAPSDTELKEACNEATATISVDGVPVGTSSGTEDGTLTAAQAALANIPVGQPTSMNDYFSYHETGEFIHRPTGGLHPATVLDHILGKDAREVLYATAPVHRMTWAPGHPERFQVKSIDETDYRAADSWLYNRYQPPKPATVHGDVILWLDLLRRLFPDDAEHVLNYFADAVQSPQHKCNHALVLGSGIHGTGKDTLLAPLRHAVGLRNYSIIKPSDLVDSTNPWVASCVVQISESRDMGDSGFTGITRYEMYERCKDLAAAPPATLLCNDKYIRKHQVLNVLRLIITTNHGTDGLHIDPEDRRHYCAWSDAPKMTEAEAQALWGWYNAGGLDFIANYLATLDLPARGWNRTARPAQTGWWHQLVSGGASQEEEKFSDALDKLQRPEWVTLPLINEAGGLELAGWTANPANRRKLEREMTKSGYQRLPNPNEPKKGRWHVAGQRIIVYRRNDIPARQLIKTFGGTP